MGILRDRVATRDQRAALAEMETAFGLRFTREAAQAAYYDSFDEALLEGGRPARPALSAQKRGIERMATAYRKAHFSAYGVEPDETWMSGLDQVIDMINPDEVQHTTSVRWKEEQRKDVTDNYLYQEWLEQLDTRDPIRTFASYAVYVSAKSAIELLTTHRDGITVLRQYHPNHLPLPMREKALALKQLPEYDPQNPAWFVAHAFALVPGLWDVAQTLQEQYGNVVRAERVVQQMDDTSPLPDDPEDESIPKQIIIPMEQRIENAIQAVLAEEGDTDSIAQKYGVPQKQFRSILRERNLMPSRGGRRSKKR